MSTKSYVEKNKRKKLLATRNEVFIRGTSETKSQGKLGKFQAGGIIEKSAKGPVSQRRERLCHKRTGCLSWR